MAKKLIKYTNKFDTFIELYENTFVLMSSSRSGHNFVIQNILSWFDTPKIWINSENMIMVDTPKETVKIILVRDLLNWYSSWLHFKSKHGTIWTPHMIVKGWYSIAREFVGETNYIKGNVVKVYYDDFFESPEYRKEICRQVDGKYNEEKLNEVTPQGNYSSFDKNHFLNNAQQMEVLTRYKTVVERKRFEKQFDVFYKQSEIIEFYIKYFEPDQIKLEFIDKNMKR